MAAPPGTSSLKPAAFKPVASLEPSAIGEPEASSGFGRWLMVLGIAVVIVAVIGYKVLSKGRAQPAVAPVAAAPSPPAAAEPPKAEPVATEALTAAPVATPPDAASAAAPAPAASVQPPAASAAAPSAASDAPSGQVVSVTLKSIPPKARFFHFGKEIGTAPFVLELKPGEKHAYEAGLPGYITRKVIVDGTKPEITVGLRKE